jgi:ATP-dependent Clp protease ATP-binding subunit ClpA
VFERFTERARQVVVLAQEEARSAELKHNYIGTEHLLLGLLREKNGIAAQVLASLDITDDLVRTQVKRIVGAGQEVKNGQIPFTPRAKEALENADTEARRTGPLSRAIGRPRAPVLSPRRGSEEARHSSDAGSALIGELVGWLSNRRSLQVALLH